MIEELSEKPCRKPSAVESHQAPQKKRPNEQKLKSEGRLEEVVSDTLPASDV
jgi:hypothetical protein